MLNPADTAWQAAHQHRALRSARGTQLRHCMRCKEVRSLCKDQDRTWSNMEVTPFDALKAEPAGLPPQLQCLRHTAATVPTKLFPKKVLKLRTATPQQVTARSGSSKCMLGQCRAPADRPLAAADACRSRSTQLCSHTSSTERNARCAASHGHHRAVLMHLATQLGQQQPHSTPRLMGSTALKPQHNRHSRHSDHRGVLYLFQPTWHGKRKNDQHTSLLMRDRADSWQPRAAYRYEVSALAVDKVGAGGANES